MRAVVTGAAGFVGSHLCEPPARPRRRGRRASTASPTTTTPGARRRTSRSLSAPSGFRLHRVDLLERAARRALRRRRRRLPPRRPARRARRPGARSSRTYVRATCWPPRRVLEAARTAPLRKVVYASSSQRLRRRRGLPDRRDAPPAPGLAVRRHQARRRAPVRALPGRIRRPHRVAAAVHRLRAPAAAGHGVLPARRRGAGGHGLRALRQRRADAATSPTSSDVVRGHARRRRVRLHRRGQHRRRLPHVA